MKTNPSLFALKERKEVKSESLVDSLYAIYELNFKIIDQIIFSTSMYQTRVKYRQGSQMNLILSSNYHVPDIQLEINYLSSFTVDVEMCHKDNKLENISYYHYVKFRIFLDAKILEVKETGFFRFNGDKNKATEREEHNEFNDSQSVQNKLTKNLLVYEWLKKMVGLKYSLRKAL